MNSNEYTALKGAEGSEDSSSPIECCKKTSIDRFSQRCTRKQLHPTRRNRMDECNCNEL